MSLKDTTEVSFYHFFFIILSPFYPQSTVFSSDLNRACFRSELGGVPRDDANFGVGRRRPTGEDVALQRLEGVGGRLLPRPLQQRLQRPLPPQGRTHS